MAALAQELNVATEQARLAQVAEFYDSRKGMSYRLVKAGAELICRHANGPRLLELGCASGVMTEIFAARFPEVVVVEGAEMYADAVRAIVGQANVYRCLFEEFQPTVLFNEIVMAGVLEHVAEPVELLRRAAGWLAPGGSIHVMVPNAYSLHRIVGVRMGMLSRPDELNSADVAMGHRRVYSPNLLKSHVLASGLEIMSLEGSFMKPLSNQQMIDLPERLLDALQDAGQEFPEFCAELYLQCRVPQSH